MHTLTMPASVDSGDVPADEAGRIARYIRSEVDAGRRSFGDFLVLTRKRKNLASYAEALEALQVPVEVSGAGAFGESKEVAQLALLLRALSDPQDGVSLVGVLRGPLFGISDQDLFAFRQAGGWFSLFSGSAFGRRLPPAVAQAVRPAVRAHVPESNVPLDPRPSRRRRARADPRTHGLSRAGGDDGWGCGGGGPAARH